MKISILALLFVLIGCGQSPLSPTTVHAGPPPAPYGGGCPNTSGAFGTTKEAPGSYIALLDNACPLFGVPQPIETDTQTLDSCGKDQVVTVTTTKDIHVHSIRLWIGAGTTSRFETGVCLEVIPPAGLPGYKSFHREWDKHVEEHYTDQPFPVDFIISSGSLVKLSRDPHSTIDCPASSASCATQEMAELWGE
ncbi:MAG TPA: hypothetical protein VGQ12_00545 [Candidatus Angelobacter sp.]|nr:hypothetical protein [Candidatus Angelobacter sp.]